MSLTKETALAMLPDDEQLLLEREGDEDEPCPTCGLPTLFDRSEGMRFCLLDYAHG